MRGNERGNKIRVKQEQSISPERKKAPVRGLLRVITDTDMEPLTFECQHCGLPEGGIDQRYRLWRIVGDLWLRE